MLIMLHAAAAKNATVKIRVAGRGIALVIPLALSQFLTLT